MLHAENGSSLRIDPHSDAFLLLLLLLFVLFPENEHKSGGSDWEVSGVEAERVGVLAGRGEARTWAARRRSLSGTTSAPSSRRRPCCDRRQTAVGSLGCRPAPSDQRQPRGEPRKVCGKSESPAGRSLPRA